MITQMRLAFARADGRFAAAPCAWSIGAPSDLDRDVERPAWKTGLRHFMAAAPVQSTSRNGCRAAEMVKFSEELWALYSPELQESEMNPQDRTSCPDCDTTLDRRTFMRAVGGVTLAGAAAPALLGRFAHAAPTPKSTAETAVVRFFNSLSEDQKSAIAFPFDHELRKKI